MFDALRMMGPYRGLFLLLSVATFFEGFDTQLVALVQPKIKEEFEVSTELLGVALGLSSSGMVLAFFVIHMADWLGRRPVFLAALLAYSVLTLATAFAPNLLIFTGLQIFARMAMVVELGLAYVILSEEMPAAIRGRVNGIFGSVAAIGASIPAPMLAPLDQLGIGWRGLFLIGGLPLLLFPLYMSRLEETRAFREQEPVPFSPREELALITRLFARAYRRSLVLIIGVFLAVNVWSGTALYFFTLYVFEERGWTSASLAWLFLGTIPFGFLGYSLSGFAMDRLGRRWAATLYFVAAFGATMLCYRSTDSVAIYLGYFLMIGLGGIWTIAITWSMELFPTEVRATAAGTTNNLFGRMGLVFAPMVAGLLSASLGSTADAISLCALVTLAALPLVWMLPETNAVALMGHPAETDSPPDSVLDTPLPQEELS
ncbi:MAG: MFS transporter [Deltaproteobacteria bacterium]|jgi:putative MFS transporter|nr:MFS transporter [Deltaproteobacteria bacterium]